ncbi:nuclear transport factor 2 family protein [Thauera sp.]|uniref:nuclear transport factor 2 family protein n=1 Tax=Thauera sp. TaxID=1905334 RepID=UPI0039E65C69
MPDAETIIALTRRIDALESERAVRACMNRYMYLCDRLDVGFPLDDLMALFTDDATWEGTGGRYKKTFGRHEGKQAIRAMFAKYTVPPAHFRLNVHYLTSELITVDDSSAHGSWVLLQPSTFSSGKSQLSSARLSVVFRKERGAWKIAEFQTEALFSRPVEHPWDASADLPVPD